jgi:uncharacterized membrane protein
MKSGVILARHPLHPMLVPIPITGFLLGLVGDIGFLATRNPFWFAFSEWTIGIGLIGGALAAAPGLVDYFTVIPHKGKPFATAHLFFNLGIMVAFFGSWLLRVLTPATTGNLFGVCMLLDVLGVGATILAAWLGGHLVYHFRVGVETKGEGEKAAFRVTLSPHAEEKVKH